MGQPIEQKENEEVKEEDKEKKIDVRDIFGGKEDHKYWVDDEENPDHRLARVNAANKGFTSSMNYTTGSHVIYKMYSKYIDAIDGNRRPFPFIHEVFDEIQTELQAEGKQLPESVWNDNTRNIIFKKRSEPKQVVQSDAIENNQQNKPISSSIRKMPHSPMDDMNEIQLADIMQKTNDIAPESVEGNANEKTTDNEIDILYSNDIDIEMHAFDPQTSTAL